MSTLTQKANLVLNVFEIWDEIGRTVPFAVRHHHWSLSYYTIVEKIECERLPYGKAFGYPTIDGYYSNHYEYAKEWRIKKRIPCDGCFEWVYVPNADFEKYKLGVQAAEKTIKGAWTINSTFRFGKFKDKFVLDAFCQSPDYNIFNGQL